MLARRRPQSQTTSLVRMPTFQAHGAAARGLGTEGQETALADVNLAATRREHLGRAASTHGPPRRMNRVSLCAPQRARLSANFSESGRPSLQKRANIAAG